MKQIISHEEEGRVRRLMRARGGVESGDSSHVNRVESRKRVIRTVRERDMES